MSIPQLRTRAFAKQNGRCYYCQQPIWEEDQEAFAKWHRLKPKHAEFMQCTAEHLTPQSEGGKNTQDNIVAACLFCNSRRHMHGRKISHFDYLKRVQKLCRKGHWPTVCWRLKPELPLSPSAKPPAAPQTPA